MTVECATVQVSIAAICLAGFRVPAGKPASQSAVYMVSIIVGRTAKIYVSGGQEILAQTEFYQLACASDGNRALIYPGAPEEFQNRPHRCRQNASNQFLEASVGAMPRCHYQDSWCK